jgi:hypothetical protein
MSITFHNSWVSSKQGVSSAVTVAPTNGHSLIVWVGLGSDGDGADTIRITDNAWGWSNAYPISAVRATNSTSGLNSIGNYLLSVKGNPTIITITCSGNDILSVVVLEYSALSALTGRAAQAQTGVGTGTDAITSGTTVGNAGDLSVAMTSGDGATAPNAGTGYTSRYQADPGGTSACYNIEDNAPNGGSGAGTFMATVSGSNYATAVMSFSPARAGGSACEKLLLMGVSCGVAAHTLEENPILTRRSLILPPRLILPSKQGRPVRLRMRR